MDWVTFAYSLSKEKSSIRVSLWRRLQRSGAIAPAGNLYVLPALAECVETFQWLTQEIQAAGGQAIMFAGNQVTGMDEQALIELFCKARSKDYEAILEDIMLLQSELKAAPEIPPDITEHLLKLRRQYAEIARIDYFHCPQGKDIENRLTQLERQLADDTDQNPYIASLNSADFMGKVWATRPQPYVDRLASIWFIRRWIDPNAVIHYRPQSEPEEVSFDMPNAHFGHIGNLCTFEVFIRTFSVTTAGIPKLAEIVHEIDLHDSVYHHPEITGIEMLLKGWLQQGLSDEQLAERGLMLFDGLLAVFRSQSG
jgi:hypothetical protein